MRPRPDAAVTVGADPADPASEHGGRVALGRITGVSGLQGWIKVHSDTAPRDNIVRFEHWWLRPRSAGAHAGDDGGWRKWRVLDGRPQGKTLVARLDGIEDRDAAVSLIGSEIAVPRSDLPATAPGEFYWTDLVGMAVRTVDGAVIGPVDRLFETGANDVVVIRDERDGAKSGSEVLVPWIRPDVVVDVDAVARCITVDWDPDF